ncbi:NAD(+)--rifampin ADP-ribosyltransferase [Cellulomonas sp. SLBN-39]|uniref:NAD(+)--rifampin ADP-ribosyltransferase n=1 Tax=Cellulomonas sp. SLBN-39 TaxID=2768446 RepID=UPI00351BB237
MTYERCGHVTGPFLHGTAAVLDVGDHLAPGHRSHFQDRALRHVYFTTLVSTAAWGAQLAAALRDVPGPGRIYVVEPQGPFEDDPNVTDKRFPGNPTRSYRTHHPLRVVDELRDWERHPPEAVEQMLTSLARLREQGLDVVED